MFKGKVGLKVILRWSYFVGKQRQRLNLRLGMNSSSEQGGGETWAQYNSTRSFLNLSSKIWRMVHLDSDLSMEKWAERKQNTVCPVVVSDKPVYIRYHGHLTNSASQGFNARMSAGWVDEDHMGLLKKWSRRVSSRNFSFGVLKWADFAFWLWSIASAGLIRRQNIAANEPASKKNSIRRLETNLICFQGMDPGI